MSDLRGIIVLGRSVMVIAVALALAGCGARSDAEANSTPEPTATVEPGRQNYESLEDLHAAVLAADVPCDNLLVDSDADQSTGRGSCSVAGGSIYLNLWSNAADRDAGASRFIRSNASRGYCLVVGRGEGDQGAWTLEANANPDICNRLGGALGGEVFQFEPGFGAIPSTSTGSTPRSTSSSPTPPTTTPPTTTPPPPSPSPTPAPPPEPEVPVGQENAARSARQYLSVLGFSRDRLINQLVQFDRYSEADATAAVDSLTVDWNEQAARSARQYLDVMGFSRDGLINQLVQFDKYTPEQAEYGASAVGL